MNWFKKKQTSEVAAPATTPMVASQVYIDLSKLGNIISIDRNLLGLYYLTRIIYYDARGVIQTVHIHMSLGQHDQLVADIRNPPWKEYKALVSKLVDLAIWMSGSPDFSPEGPAHEGWLRAQDTLNEAREVINDAKI